MGQYYITVNVDKRQFLDPHNFGGGLKLMEFSGQQFCLPQALCILLAHANGRGGGDLHIDGKRIPQKEADLVGSWAGDRIVVAGDYDDEWKWVPEDLKGKVYEEEEYVNGYGSEKKKVKRKFGEREIPGVPGSFYGETLYSAARTFFEDISDRIIKVVAKADAPYHPWAAMDVSDDGWRRVPDWATLPETEPKKPIAGKACYNAYKKHATK